MYRNCVYSNNTRSIHLWTFNKDGERIKEELSFSPYLFLENSKGEHKSIYGTPLKKKSFPTLWDRNKFVKDAGMKRIFENFPPYQQYLIDNYYNSCGDDDFSRFPLKIMFLDLECPGPIGGAFPEPEKAENPIDLLTVFDSFSKRYRVFGLKPYQPEADNVDYIHCKSEEELLKKFIKYFESDYPDCVVGYNSNNFDIPYLVNRITNVLNEDWAKRLSPIGRYYEKINQDGKFGLPVKQYVIEGISLLDYYVMYRKFALQPLESYKLDYVAEVELNERKVEYEGSLAELSIKDWKKYVEYNIKDVEILVKLDDKLRYIELLRFISYLGLCNMENAIRTVPVINGAVAIRARFRGVKIPTFIRNSSSERIPGAYVAEPRLGFVEKVVSFDANSLYPSIMISLNMSPETKLGKVEKIGDIYHVKHVSGQTFELTEEKYSKLISSEKIAKSEANILFSQKKKGLMPEFLEFLYDKRKEMKTQKINLEKLFVKEKKNLSESERNERKSIIQKYDTFQNAYKITLNSTYGYCANKHAPLGDLEIGSSVTLTGQAIIKKSVDIYKEFLKKKVPDISTSELEKAYIYSDTDSDFLSFKWIDMVGIKFMEDGKITKEFFNICDEVEKALNIGICEWAKKELGSVDPRFVFKRETVCDTGVFLGKKYYVLSMRDKEGVSVNEFKYKGVDVVKSTMPKALKPIVREIIEFLVRTQDLKQTNALFLDAYKKFKDLGVDSIYKNSGINNYEQYAAKCNGFQTVKGMPAHVKAAYFHDLIVEKLGLDKKYAKFRSGDKVKSAYVKTPNKYNIDCIGFKGKFPEEFYQIFSIDYEKMFDKIVFAAIERFYDAVNWKLRKPTETVKIELEDFFKEDD